MEQLYESNFYICGMQHIPYLGATAIRNLIETYGGPFEAWCALQDRNKLKAIIGIQPKKIPAIMKAATQESLAHLHNVLEKYHITWITYLDMLFPARLQEIYNPPAVIFVRGNMDLLKDETFKIAMVGARNCSDYGRNVARYLGRELSNYDVAIVSGGARGIDSHSHEGALANNGQVIIVLGCGLDIVYPPENKQLFDTVIANNGLLLSEYTPGTPPTGKHFPMRNRIIGGLSTVVIVVEARASSGSLITADMANSDGREIYVVPGSILSSAAEGSHWLIRQGAHVLTKAQDLVEDYNLAIRLVDTKGNNVISCKLESETVLDLIPLDTCISVDKLIRKTGIPLQRIQSILLDLEMKHLIEKVQSRGYIKIMGSEVIVH